jgi:hypothetical protein
MEGMQCTVSLKGMKKAASSIEDFVRSNFMFHGLDPSRPADVFKYLPTLAFVEAYIYELDEENELVNAPGVEQCDSSSSSIVSSTSSDDSSADEREGDSMRTARTSVEPDASLAPNSRRFGPHARQDVRECR